MRKRQRKSSDLSAQQLLREAPTYHLATLDDSGSPLLRVLNGVLVDDWVLFHGALVGEKARTPNRPAVVSAHESIASIPSYFVDSEKACPATTYYRSVQARGTLMQVDDPVVKARMFQALMEKYQPEGGHTPFDGNLEFYRKDLGAVLVFGLRIESVCGKESLGQDRPKERVEKVVKGLWQRGAAGDLRAISLILEHSPAARPAAWQPELEGKTYCLEVFQEPQWVRAHAQLLGSEYWRKNSKPQDIERAIESSAAWVGLCNADGQLCAAGRAISDASWVAYVMDVVVRPDLRGRGLGTVLMRFLLDHPMLRNSPFVRLGTKDAMAFYRRLGFADGADPGRDFVPTIMTRVGVSDFDSPSSGTAQGG